MPKIELKDVVVSYFDRKGNETEVIHKLNTTFEDGTFNCVIGFSGCGKTTLLRAILDLEPYDGDILFDGVEGRKIKKIDKNLAYIPQNLALYPTMSVFENIAFPLKILKTDRDEIVERVNEIAKRLGIQHILSRRPRQISIGQQQRVAIARALVKRPSVCLFDEPLSNLDPELRYETRRFLKELFEGQNITVIYVTHELEEALSLSDKIYYLDEGVISYVGTPEEIMESDNELIKFMKENIH